MNPKGKKKLIKKSAKNMDGDDCMINDEGLMINKTLSLTICLKPQDDFPHPRHLCFTYPFGNSSPKNHCLKCYCYVCEKVAPCKYWKKTPNNNRHCDATDKDEKWVSLKKLTNKLPGATTMVYHKLSVTATYLVPMGHVPEEPYLPTHGYGSGLICNADGEWLIAISMRLCSRSTYTRDIIAESYKPLLDSLNLAWSRGFRRLEVILGFTFQDEFWGDFTRNLVTNKFRLCDENNNTYNREQLDTLKQVENYLNREWFVTVKIRESIEEESGSLFVAGLANAQEEPKKVYDFKTNPLTLDTEMITRDLARVMRQSMNHLSPELRRWIGLES